MTVHSSEHPERELAERLVRELEAMPQATVALSGGSTPRTLFRVLASGYADHIDWSRVTVFQVDERMVPPDHIDSNWRMIREELLSKVRVGEACRMRAEQPAAAEEYEKLVRDHAESGDDSIPQIDIVLLGMGKDGHTASLFPQSPALDESQKLVVRTEAPSLGTERITLTFPLINVARHKFFLVRGSDKAEAFRRTQEGETPAGRVTDAEWYVDPPVVS